MKLHGYKNSIPQEMTSGALGLAGEQTMIADVQRKGLKARKAAQKQGDIQIFRKDGTKVCTLEVKTARKGKQGGFKFCLYRKVGNRVCTDHKHADFVVLLAVSDDATVTVFVIPSTAINQKNIHIGNPLTCKKFEQYRVQ